jgi:regulatory protein
MAADHPEPPAPAGRLSGTITALEAQQRDPERVNVYLDGRFAFGLDARAVADAGLRKGDALSPERVAALLKRDAFEQALQQAFHFLSFRNRSVAEIRRRLGQKGHPPEIVDAVLARLVDRHYVNDEVFALSWVENRQRFRPRGPHLLRTELVQKGVERETIDQALADAAGDERALARAAAARRLPALRGTDYPEFSRKLGGFLSRRGFSADVVWQVVKELWAEQGSAGEAPDERE